MNTQLYTPAAAATMPQGLLIEANVEGTTPGSCGKGALPASSIFMLLPEVGADGSREARPVPEASNWAAQPSKRERPGFSRPDSNQWHVARCVAPS